MQDGDSFDLAYVDSQQIGERGEFLEAENYRYYYDSSMLKVLNHPGVYDGLDLLEKCLAIKNQFMNVSAMIFNTASIRRCLAHSMNEISQFKVAGDWYVYVTMFKEPGAKGKFLLKA